MPPMNRRRFLGGLSALALPAQAREPGAPQRREFVAPHMGTLWRLVFFDDDESRARAARDAAWARLTELNARLSDYLDRQRTLAPLPRRTARVAQRRPASRADRRAPPGRTDRRRVRRHRRPPGPALARGAPGKGAARPRQPSRRRGRSSTGAPSSSRRTPPSFAPATAGSTSAASAKDLPRTKCCASCVNRHGLDAVLIDAGGGVSVGAPPPGQSGWTAGIAPQSDDDPGVTLT
jgi:hypothetical protein